MSLHYYGKPLVCTYSGGKDSDVVLELFRRAGIPYEVHHSLTTADAPQTVRYIREKFRRLELDGVSCEIEMPTYMGRRISMWQLIPQKLMPPTRLVRYCCSVLKETGCRNRYIATGARWDESKERSEREEFEKIGKTKKDKEKFSTVMLMNDNGAKRRVSELCMQKKKMVVNPIIDWTHHDVWEFIRSERLETNVLYQCEYDRVGCIGCPIANKKRWKEFADFPKYRDLYIHAFDRMLKERERRGKHNRWKDGYDVFLWWMEDDNIRGQISIKEYLESLEEDGNGEETE